MKRFLLIAFLCAGLVAACGDDPEEGNNVTDEDVGADVDAGPDAEPDADAGPDEDIGPDADAGQDADANGDGEEEEPNDSLEDANPIQIGGDITGVIGDVGEDAFDYDFYVLTMSPGDRVRVEVAADDALQPFIFVGELFEGNLFSVGEARSVNGAAAIEFTYSDDANEDADFVIAVTDERNEPINPDDPSENVGGDEFGYTLTVSEATWTPTEETLPVDVSGSIDEIGTYAWYQFDVPADTLLGVEVTTEATDFLPFSAFLQPDGTAFPNPPMTALPVFDETPLVAGVRDEFFRGGAGFDFNLNIQTASFGNLTFNDVTEGDANNSIANAQDIGGNIPAGVTATATGTDDSDLDADYFSVSLSEGESLGVFTGPGADDQVEDADTVLFILDPDGNEVYFNDDYPLSGNFFSAGLITADQTGDYIVAVEPFCTPDGCFEGDYTLFAFIEPAN